MLTHFANYIKELPLIFYPQSSICDGDMINYFLIHTSSYPVEVYQAVGHGESVHNVVSLGT